jgi:biotin transport system substrate-specific component
MAWFEPMNAPSAILSRTSLLDRVLWISFFALATGLSAWVTIPLPFTPVPITLQTLAVLTSGIVLGKDGIYSMVAYLILGGIGLPMFAGGEANLTSLFGAAGGYLIGFVGASALAGKVLHSNWATLKFHARFIRLLLISLVIFVPGVIQLALVLKVSLGKALLLGFVPFLPGDLIKTALAAATPASVLRR